jgi:hypothetical protein
MLFQSLNVRLLSKLHAARADIGGNPLFSITATLTREFEGGQGERV